MLRSAPWLRSPLAGLAAAALACPVALAAPLRWSSEFELGYDSNLNNAPAGRGAHESGVLRASAALARSTAVGAASFTLRELVEAQAVRHFDDLSHLRAALQLRWQQRLGAGRFAPGISLSGSLGRVEFAGALRDANELRTQLAVSQTLGTRLAGRLFAGGQWAYAPGPTFDIATRQLGFDLDYRASERLTLYGGWLWQRGDFVTTAASIPVSVLPSVRGQARDDAYADGERAFRQSGRFRIPHLGFNWQLGEHWALDGQWQRAEVRSTLGTAYQRDQTLLSLLGRW